MDGTSAKSGRATRRTRARWDIEQLSVEFDAKPPIMDVDQRVFATMDVQRRPLTDSGSGLKCGDCAVAAFGHDRKVIATPVGFSAESRDSTRGHRCGRAREIAEALWGSSREFGASRGDAM